MAAATILIATVDPSSWFLRAVVLLARQSSAPTRPILLRGAGGATQSTLISSLQATCNLSCLVRSWGMRSTLGFTRAGIGGIKILKYELESHEKSAIDLPHIHSDFGDVHIITLDGGLGLATQRKSKLYMWSRKNGGLRVDAGWTQTRVIDLLQMMFRSNATLALRPDVVGVADDIGVIFLRTRTDDSATTYTFDLKTYKVKKICEGERFYSIFPYMSFYTPGTAY